MFLFPKPVNFSHSFTVSCPPVEENRQCFPTEPPTTTIATTTVDHNDSAANNSSEKEAPEEEGGDGKIIGIVVAVVILIVFVVVGIVLYRCKNRKATKDQEVSIRLKLNRPLEAFRLCMSC